MSKRILNVDIYESKEINFIKLFHRILLVFLCLIVLALVFIPVNDSISFKSGEVISKNPQIDYKAPFEVIPRAIFVKKGDRVKKGDTLMIIDNASLDKDFSSTQGRYVSLEQQDKTVDIDKLNVEEKIDFLIKEKTLNAKDYKNSRRQIYNSLKGVKNKISLLKEQERLKYNKIASDSIMYRKEVISLVELRKSYNEYLNTKNEVVNAQNQSRDLNGKLSIVKNDYEQKLNTLKIQISDLKANQGRLEQQKEDLTSKLQTQGKSVDFMQSEINKQYLTSKIDGVVSSMFNENLDFNFISKGESLVIITPDEESFYARAKIQEQDLKYIEVGQRANLKLDAYYYFKYGIIKGAVSFVPEHKERDNNFYVLIDLPENNRLNLRTGYSIKGDIILNKMKLGGYLLKKMFQSYDSQMGIDEKPSGSKKGEK